MISVFSPPSGPNDIFNFRSPRVVRPFPRYKSVLYALICLLWLSFGITGRDPWKPEELILTAVVADMAMDGLRLSPLLLDSPYYDSQPLYLWLAALFARLTSDWLPLHEGARLSNVFLLGGGFIFIGWSMRRSYGMRAAWLALLLLVGTTGFMIRGHLLNNGIPAFFGVAMAIFGLSALLGDSRRPVDTLLGCAVIGVSVAFLLLACGWLPAAAVAVAIVFTVLADSRHNRFVTLCGIAIFALPPMIWWGLVMPDDMAFHQLRAKWSDGGLAMFTGAFGDMVRIAAWSLFPVLPLAVVGLWMERQKMAALARFSVLLSVVLLLVFYAQGAGEEGFYALLPPLAILAGRALQVMPDENARVLDFFALLVVGLVFGGGLWLVWLALYSGAPAALASMLATSYGGFVLPPVAWGKVVLAAILTVGWLVLIARFGRSNERAALHWGYGVTFLWSVFNLLLVGYVDSGKSYRPPALAIAKQVKPYCLQAPPNRDWRAQLHYFGVPLGDKSCVFYLDEEDKGNALWSGARAGDSRHYHLYRRF